MHKQYVIYQLLKALYFLHTADLIHRDVKPSNLCVASAARARAHFLARSRTAGL